MALRINADVCYILFQEDMSGQEIGAAIHTDSRHADRLRSAYSSKETSVHGYVIFKRIDFLGSRKSFEMLKRVSGDNNSNVYELLIRAWCHHLKLAYTLLYSHWPMVTCENWESSMLWEFAVSTTSFLRMKDSFYFALHYYPLFAYTYILAFGVHKEQ